MRRKFILKTKFMSVVKSILTGFLSILRQLKENIMNKRNLVLEKSLTILFHYPEIEYYGCPTNRALH